MFARTQVRNALARYFQDPGARFLHTLRLTPNAVTLLGLAMSLAAASLAAAEWLLASGLLLLVASAMDMLDGALARLSGKESPRGALLDSVSDRLAEAAVLMGLFILYLRTGSDRDAVLAFMVLVASFMVSYLRARGEGLGITMRETGLFTRTERVVVLVLGLLTNLIIPALAIVLALSTYTFSQRLYHLWRYTRNE